MLRGLSLLSTTKLMGQRQMSSLSRFDLDTALNRVKDFHYRGEVTDRWSVGNAPNGGYLMMMAINAAKQCIDHPDPLSITAYYANKSIESHPVDIAVRIVTKARSSTTVHITMSQAGDTKSEYLAVFGDIDKFKGFSFSNKPTLSLPPRQDCLDCTKTIRKFGKHVKLFQELQILLPKDDPFVKGDGFFHGKQGEKALLNCWVKFEDVRKPCLPSLAFFLDALPPPVVNLTPTFWVPTLELTVHFWSKPPLPSNAQGGKEEDDYWLQGKFETIFATNGTLYTDAEIWSADGNQLLATSRQYARILDPKNK